MQQIWVDRLICRKIRLRNEPEISIIAFIFLCFRVIRSRLTYHRVRKVRTTHIMSDHRTTTMAFTQRTDLQVAITLYH